MSESRNKAPSRQQNKNTRKINLTLYYLYPLVFPLPQYETFRNAVLNEEQNGSLSIPKILDMLNEFLKNPGINFRMIFNSMDDFIQELKKHIQISEGLVFDYLKERKTMKANLIADFRDLYRRHLRYPDTDKELRYYSDDCLLSLIQYHIKRNQESNAAICWNIVLKYESKADQAQAESIFFPSMYQQFKKKVSRSTPPAISTSNKLAAGRH